MGLALVLMSAGCARHSVSAGVAPAARAEATTIEVQNDSWSDVVVYVVDHGTRRRLGLVSSNSSTSFSWKSAGAIMGPLELIARPIAGRAFQLPSVLISGGQAVAVKLMNQLSLSYVTVRDR